MASQLYNSFKVDQANGDIDFTNDNIKVLLVTDQYVPNINTHKKRSDITDEVVGAGYVAGGQAMANINVVQDDSNNRATLDANDNQWTPSTITARGAVLYKDVGSPATDLLIGYLDFGTDIISANGDFDITWDAIGFMTMT